MEEICFTEKIASTQNPTRFQIIQTCHLGNTHTPVKVVGLQCHISQ